MKKILTLGTLALALAVSITFTTLSLTGCDTGGGGSDDSVTYTSTDEAGNTYRLTISSAARYTARVGDNYILTITFTGGTIETTRGTVEEVVEGNIKLSGPEGSADITVTIFDGKMIKLEGTITDADGNPQQFSIDLTPGSGSSSGLVSYTGRDKESYNDYTLTISATPRTGDNWFITSDDERVDGRSGKIVSVSGNKINLGKFTLTGEDDNGSPQSVEVEIVVTIKGGKMTQIDLTFKGDDIDDSEILILTPQGSGSSGGSSTITTITTVTGTRYVYTLPDWGYLLTFKFESGEPAVSGNGTAYYEAGANHISCQFTYSSGDHLTITWPPSISPYPEDYTKATSEQAVAASFNIYANGTYDSASALWEDAHNLSKPREFSKENGNIVGTSSISIFGEQPTTQIFTFEKKQ